MKKRNDEGFALAYVVVVIFILCSIAIALMSSTLRTLQAQENMVQRMKDKYEAMGEIERFVAELEFNNPNLASDSNYTEDPSEAEYDAVEAFAAHLMEYNDPDTLVLNNISTDHDDHLIFFDVHSTINSVTVSATLSISPVYEIMEDEIVTNQTDIDRNPDLNIVPDIEYWYDFIVTGINNVCFISYEIISAGGDT